MAKVADLEDPKLDAWVVRALGETVVERDGECYIAGSDGEPFLVVPPYSSNWCNGGPIIERLDFDFFHDPESDRFAGAGQRGASLFLPSRPGETVTVDYLGPTYLIAAMRCVVAAKFGAEVDG